MLHDEKLKELERFATDIRIHTIRQIGKRGFGHMGGCMSIADLLSVLYGHSMRYDPARPDWDARDWLICSKGHAGPAVYAALALKEFFPMSWLETLNQPNTSLPSHCDRKKTPGIDMTTGSLGQGLSVACGVALGFKLEKKDNRVFCVIGDGESQEGQNWEAILFAAQNRLDNLVLFIDDNKIQLDDYTENICNMQSFKEKMEAFHWNCLEVDGHDHKAIAQAVDNAAGVGEKPTAIVLHTTKGKGCTFAERLWNHHMTVSNEQMEEALAALGARQ